MWTMLNKKDVLDFDGFWTEYTMYTNGTWFVCVFGDCELYGPEDEDNWDFATDFEEEATEWFEEYDTIGDADVAEYNLSYCEETGWYE